LGWLVVASVGVGCGSATGSARYPVEKIPVPDPSEIYTHEARPDGVTGGPGGDKVEAEVLQLLRSRGAAPRADGALGATACWMLREINEGRRVDSISIDIASHYFGFGGVVTSGTAFGMNDRDSLRDTVAAMPKNIPLTRYGICVSPAGVTGAVTMGNMEASYETISRAVEPGSSVTLKGELASRFKSTMIFLTNPDGTVVQKDSTSRGFDQTFLFDKPGVYRMEVMGDDGRGPSIVINLPVYVGMPEPVARGSSGAVVDPEEAEARLLVLLNEARVKAGARALPSDPELVEVARSHSEDMADHHFFAHVSPTTGAPDDRMRRAKLLVSKFGENCGLGGTPEEIHQGLMSSPGHRMNMLLPDYTHVGIAAEKGEGALVVTMNFARRPPPASVPKSIADVETAIRNLRTQKGLKPYEPDPVYRGGAQAGADALARGAEEKEIKEAVGAGLQREADRLQVDRPANCIIPIELLEIDQTNQIPHLLSPTLGRLGVASRFADDKRGKRLATVIILDGTACNP
jgi:uncharacterized protein YkwD